jgi:hypothetical protein
MLLYKEVSIPSPCLLFKALYWDYIVGY